MPTVCWEMKLPVACFFPMIYQRVWQRDDEMAKHMYQLYPTAAVVSSCWPFVQQRTSSSAVLARDGTLPLCAVLLRDLRPSFHQHTFQIYQLDYPSQHCSHELQSSTLVVMDHQ